MDDFGYWEGVTVEARSVFERAYKRCLEHPEFLQRADDSQRRQIQWHLRKGYDDCCWLDAGSTAPVFLERYNKALHAPNAYLGLMFFVVAVPPNMKTWNPIWKAFSEGKLKGEGKLVAYQLRELARDGISVDQALSTLSEQISAQAEGGEVEFFGRVLPDVLKEITNRPERFVRSWPEIYRRTWVPLALWECWSDFNTVHSRIAEAAMAMPNIELPGDLGDGAVFTSMSAAWRAFRPL